MLFTIQPCWEQFSELFEKKKRLFSALAFRLSSRLGLAERESKRFDLSGRVAPSPLLAFQKERKKKTMNENGILIQIHVLKYFLLFMQCNGLYQMSSVLCP